MYCWSASSMQNDMWSSMRKRSYVPNAKFMAMGRWCFVKFACNCLTQDLCNAHYDCAAVRYDIYLTVRTTALFSFWACWLYSAYLPSMKNRRCTTSLFLSWTGHLSVIVAVHTSFIVDPCGLMWVGQHISSICMYRMGWNHCGTYILQLWLGSPSVYSASCKIP